MAPGYDVGAAVLILSLLAVSRLRELRLRSAFLASLACYAIGLGVALGRRRR